jgi:hypothetical protein
VRGGRRGLATIAFATACSPASSADAQEDRPRIELGARLGYGLPLGDVDTHDSLSGAVGDPLGQTIGGMVPIWIDAGYRFAPRWVAGLFFVYAPGWLGGGLHGACDSASDCSVFDMRAGVELQYHLAPQERWDPWLGAGLGYEWLHIGFSQRSSPLWASGFELVNLQAGLDGAVGTRVRLGPFAAATAAVYSWNDSLPSSNTFGGQAMHGWVVLGIRGVIDLARRPAAEPEPDARWSGP